MVTHETPKGGKNLEKSGKGKSSLRFHVATIPKKAIRLSQNWKVLRSTTTIVDMEVGCIILLLSYKKRTKTRVDFFHERQHCNIFKGTDGVCGIKICWY